MNAPHDPQLTALLEKHPDPRAPVMAGMNAAIAAFPLMARHMTERRIDAEIERESRAETRGESLKRDFLAGLVVGRGEAQFDTAFGVGTAPLVDMVDDLMSDLWCDQQARSKPLQLALIASDHPAAAELRRMLADAYMAKHGDKLAGVTL